MAFAIGKFAPRRSTTCGRSISLPAKRFHLGARLGAVSIDIIADDFVECHAPPLPLPFSLSSIGLWFLFVPRLGSQRQFVQLSARFPPGRVMFTQDSKKTFAVLRVDEMDHFVDSDIFQQILRFGNQLRVEPDMSRSVIATSPLGFHSLEEVLFDADLQFWLPFADKFRDDLMQKGLMPFMHHFRPFLGIAAGSYAKSDASMVERNGRLSIQEGNAQKITPSPMFAFVRGELAAQAKDYWQAACWYYIATINGHPRAAVSFGEMRRKRLGVTKDPEDALNCMEIGGREGDYLGAAIASEMYKNGEGTAPNPQKAAEWLAKAKELKAKQDQEEAKERKEETEYQAELHALEIIGEAGAKMFMNELRRSPECDVMCSQSDYSNGSCASRIQQRDSDLANHKINCDATIPEF